MYMSTSPLVLLLVPLPDNRRTAARAAARGAGPDPAPAARTSVKLDA